MGIFCTAKQGDYLLREREREWGKVEEGWGEDKKKHKTKKLAKLECVIDWIKQTFQIPK